jgi:molybdopterin/thiamine biosynthesis adenylyltransferase
MNDKVKKIWKDAARASFKVLTQCPDEIQTRYLSNTWQNHHHLSQLLSERKGNLYIHTEGN